MGALYPVSGLFRYPKCRSHIRSAGSPGFPLPSAPQPLVCFLSPWVCVFWTVLVNEVAQHTSDCFRWARWCSQVHPRRDVCQYLIPLRGRVIFCWMVIHPRWFIGLSVGGGLGCFSSLDIVNNAAVNRNIFLSPRFQLFWAHTQK